VGVVTTLRIDTGHPALDGHFPGAPILPGVVLLDETVRAVEQSGSAPQPRWRIGTAKFVKPVHPGETLTLEHTVLPDGSIRFSVSSAGHPVAHGVLRPAEAPAARSAAPRAASAPRTGAAHWAAPERGSAFLVRLMIDLSLALGRRGGRVLLYSVVLYFFLFAPRVRRHAREYLRRALGRPPTARDRFRQVFAFAATTLDRVYLVRGRYEQFALSSEGEALMRSMLARGGGAFLLGAHLGSFEIMRATAKRVPGLKVAMAMYEDNSRVRAFMGTGDSANAPEIIPLGHMEAMLRIRDRLDAGGFVGMLADRTIREGPAQPVSFLGRPALFPSGPMRAAAALRRPVIFMTGLYRGGNRYHVVFRQIADFSQTPRGEREQAVRAAIKRYAGLLEEYCRSDPYNWFNFYDFWHGADSSGDGARGTAA
jgi:predicted LPLAT superfamily acyltransferase/3-hydroxymyristoyl/3-hydroxydecanoyl-(acyl carrier protein) dehydratase